MKNIIRLHSIIIGACLYAQAEELTEIVVSESRYAQAAGDVSSAVTVIDPRDEEKQGSRELIDVLNASPGVIATSTGGQTGALGSLFIRGTSTAYSQMVVDGMKLSNSTVPMGNALSSSRVGDLGRIEVLRGAQGAAYGGEAIGGVLWLETRKGGACLNEITAELGSFDSLFTQALHAGGDQNFSWFLSGSYEESNNDAPKQDYYLGSIALRTDAKVNDDWTLTTTYRGSHSYFNNLGQSDDDVDASLLTFKVEGEITPEHILHLLAGYHVENYESVSSYGTYSTDLNSYAFSADDEWHVRDDIKILYGASWYHTLFENSIGTDVIEDNEAIYAGYEQKLSDAFLYSAMLRWENFDAFGSKVTGRIGSRYDLAATKTSFLAGLGTSYRAPTFLDLYGSSFGAGNPNLNTEDGLGWDIGIEQQISDSHKITITYFENEIDEFIRSSPAPPVNVNGTSKTNGIEFSAEGKLLSQVNYSLAYTWLAHSLNGMPHHSANASLNYQATPAWMIGAGIRHLSDHSWGGTELDSYTVARLFTEYRVNEHLKINARLENLLDENYELSNFYGTKINGAGAGAYLGATVSF